ncbi:pyruvate-ferredoxin/flavodoxin oxidoreductase [Rhodoblastus acidophilus]|uniref:2-oxoacid:acceptor oxidoreductase family protein n=1 Tax=Rhodoblastus acidophilus TaxID=1074 RepID=UPI002224EF15|nr:2-oxoacid:acceptor oxidoreductase family protein [Rhodoblastus acidophilus]MCW2286447.1 pyruvate-ferredoxin/flavodoxin oxidoreductase [Rhodoblastus acidophilus]MCW2335296.1 pyruvate-ferredoxin/flavodoxin oxidoreductase [Rhodoblastus acidophilus]
MTRFPGLPTVINGNGAVAHVMSHVCGGVIGYPITPSTEIAENFENFRANGGVNVWGQHPFFYEPEGEHSAQSGAMGAALTGGKYVSNASSSQGVLYALESHYVTVGKKVGGFVLHVAARVVSRHSLNVMAGHDDVYALLLAGYTILFAANPQEAADFAALSYRIAANALIPVANAMDGFATSHMMSEALLPEPELLRTFIGDPAARIPAPTVAQEMLFGAKGRVWQIGQWFERHAGAFDTDKLEAARKQLAAKADAIETDTGGVLLDDFAGLLPQKLAAPFRRLWLNAWEKGTRQRVPALVDVNNPGLTGGVQNQPDFQSGCADHRAHFAADVPRFIDEAFVEYAALTGRVYRPVMGFEAEDAETVLIGLGSVTEDAEAVAAHLRKQGRKVGVLAVKQLQPFPEAEIVEALKGKRAATILERSENIELTSRVMQALCKAPRAAQPRLTTAIFGLGGHDLQPRHLVAAYDNMDRAEPSDFVYLGSQFMDDDASPAQQKLGAAYPDSLRMGLPAGENPQLLPEGALRIRFHSIGGYGTIATGKLATDILAGALNLHSKSAPKYGSEKSGAPTNFYITLSPEPVKLTNAELEDVEVVVSPDHMVFAHADPLRGLREGGAFFLQSHHSTEDAWRALPASARAEIRAKNIRFFVLDAFAVAKRHAPSPELATRMMGVAFIGALCGRMERMAAGADASAVLERIRKQIAKKFGSKGEAVVAGNMAVISEGLEACFAVPYQKFGDKAGTPAAPHADLSERLGGAAAKVASPSGLFSAEYFNEIFAKPMRDGRIGESAILPGTGLFMPPASAAAKDKGLFRREAPEFLADKCTGCLECTLVCPDAAMPCTVHEIDDLLFTAARRAGFASKGALADALVDAAGRIRDRLAETPRAALHALFAEQGEMLALYDGALSGALQSVAKQLASFPVAKTGFFFDQYEKKAKGEGGLFSVGVDPAKCSGCLECVAVCGAKALRAQEQDEAGLAALRARFAFLADTANTPARFSENQSIGNAKRLMLDRDNYYATSGGHGACRGCGEVTAIRQIASAAHALHRKSATAEIAEIEELSDKLGVLLETLPADGNGGSARRARIEATLTTLQKRLFELECGPTGAGQSGLAVANATGCSSVYCSTFPYNAYRDPWVNSLFQDTPALAKGLFEGMAADIVTVVKARRVAELELAGAYDENTQGRALKTLNWENFTEAERARIPTIFSMGGDGANYDIGFGALSKLLTTKAPVKVVILNTGGYSNTGGQASSSSYLGQDADLARIGAAHDGKQDDRKELSLIAAMHPKVMVVQTSPSIPGHFLRNVLTALAYQGGPVVLDIYTPCQGENGVGDDLSHRHGRLAVSSRMAPVFTHDPEAGETLSARLSLTGNPGVESDWDTSVLSWTDDKGERHEMEVPFTPADFALREGRFKRHFGRPLSDDVEAAVPVAAFIDLPAEEREGVTPFVWTIRAGRLARLSVSPALVRLVEERRRNWRQLKELAGYPLLTKEQDATPDTAAVAPKEMHASALH